MNTQPTYETEFQGACEIFSARLIEEIPNFIARLENELMRQGEMQLDWLSSLEAELLEAVRGLLSLPVHDQLEPPIGMIRRIIHRELEAHSVVNWERIRERGFLPTSAIDISPELADAHLAWGIAKARSMHGEVEGTAS